MKNNDSSLALFANQLADKARKVTLSYFRQPLNQEYKQDGSPVTIADKKTEKILRNQIAKVYPTHSILGEEFAYKQNTSEYEWIIDPIDGTKSFLSGNPLYGTLICLLKSGTPIISIIDMPYLNERFIAVTNKKSQSVIKANKQTIQTSTKQSLSQCICYSTDESMFSTKEIQQLSLLRQEISLQRYTGDCYLYAMLASGWIDLVIEADLKPYDFLPLILIIENAGGVITDWEGKPLNKNSSGQVLAAANPKLHDIALKTL